MPKNGRAMTVGRDDWGGRLHVVRVKLVFFCLLIQVKHFDLEHSKISEKGDAALQLPLKIFDCKKVVII